MCPECGGWRWMSARRVRAIASGVGTAVCPSCRRPPEENEREREQYRRWWLTRYSDEELADLAAAFGRVHPATLAAARDALSPTTRSR